MDRLEDLEQLDQEKLIFALDIGTRSVIGSVGIPGDGPLRILDFDVEEYKNRAVVDGQIEDIEETAKVASVVKRRLEERLHVQLKNVYIAAAGRVLKTQRAENEMALENGTADRSFLAKLESGAIHNAYNALFPEDRADDSAEFFCVGHSAVRYSIDGYEMSTILNHTGKTAHVDVIATFLPREVVESLYTTMRAIGLSVAGLTLEPIAAMNAVIPTDIRKLNLALVDIGAGTSDIAVCDNGSVTAYTMATVAGDEITEAIMKEFLVDFHMAEEMKHKIKQGGEPIAYENILGLTFEESQETLLMKLEPVLEELSGVICRKIIEVNGKSPAAVFLTGGGSQIPTLCPRVAAGLAIDENRVAVGGSNYMKKMVKTSCEIYGPEFATPLGIALTAADRDNGEAFSVTINGEKLHLVKSWNMTVLDALLLGGCKYSQIMGHVGKGIIFELNGERRTVRGSLPGQSNILLNGEHTALSAQVSPGDVLEFLEAVPGKDAEPLLSDIIEDWNCFTVTFNEAEILVGTVTTINGNRAESNLPIKRMDSVEFRRVLTLASLCRELDVDPGQFEIVVNGEEVSPSVRLKPGDKIIASRRAVSFHSPVIPEPLFVEPEEPVMEEAELPPARELPAQAAPEPVVTGPSAPSSSEIIAFLNGGAVILPRKADGGIHQFVDLFNYIDIDPKNPQGNIVLKLNGKDASYLDAVSAGDHADIYWEKDTKER